VICDPSAHKMDLDTYDIGLHEGRCTICHAYLTYKWDYDENQFTNSTYHNFHNMDMATMGDYNNPLQSFAVLSRVDDDPKLEYGVFIIPYTSVTITSLKDGVQTTTTDIINPTYEKLKSKYNEFGSHVDHGFPGKRSTNDQFNKAWQKIVLNDGWLKKTYVGSWNAINIKRVADKFRPRKV